MFLHEQLASKCVVSKFNGLATSLFKTQSITGCVNHINITINGLPSLYRFSWTTSCVGGTGKYVAALVSKNQFFSIQNQ